MVHFLPLGLEKFFTNLHSLRVKKSNLREIHKNNFAAFPSLRYLNLEHNALSILEGDLFALNPHLETIWLGHNKIEEIDLVAFDGLKDLKDLDLRGVACIGRSPNRHDVQAVIEAMKKSCRNCPRGLEEVETKLAKLNGEFKEILEENQKMKSMAGNLEKLEDKNEHLSAERVKLRTEIDRKDAEFKKMRAEWTKLNAELMKSNSLEKKSRAELQKTSAELKQVKANVLNLRAELEKSKAEHQESHTELKTHHVELQVIHENLKAELNNSKVQHQKSKAELQKNLNECQKMNQQKDKQSAEYNNSIAELRNAKLEAEILLEKLKNLHQIEIKKLQNENSVLKIQKLKFVYEEKILTNEIQILRNNSENRKNLTTCDELREKIQQKNYERDAETFMGANSLSKDAEIGKIPDKFQNVVQEDGISINSLQNCLKNEKITFLVVCIIVLVVLNAITIIYCCLRTKRYAKSMRISSLSEYSEEFNVPLRSDDGKIKNYA